MNYLTANIGFDPVLSIRITEIILILYYGSYFIFDIFLFSIFLFSFRKKKQLKHEDNLFSDHSVTIIVPAYNEDVSIVNCIRMLMNLDYPNYEIIAVNDGSTDKTTKKILESFSLNQVENQIVNNINTQRIERVFQSLDKKFVLIDKINGGKADAVNVGINAAKSDYICTIDADSILDKFALKDVMTSFIQDKSVFVSGGQLAISNDTHIENNKIVNARMPSNIWVLWQIVEYIKSFMISRTGLSKLNALLIMSGAFSIYKKVDLMNVGGFLTPLNTHEYIVEKLGENKSTVCEDMEIVVRLWRYNRELKKKVKAVFMPQPICWTEVPEKSTNLLKQRNRWHRGLAETLYLHREILFEPAYGATGLLAFPYYIFYELLAPIIKIITVFFLFGIFLSGLINVYWAILILLTVTIISALITSTTTVFIENWSRKQTSSNRDALRYKNTWNWLGLVSASIIGNFSYIHFRTFAQIGGIIDFFKKSTDWKKFDRVGIITNK